MEVNLNINTGPARPVGSRPPTPPARPAASVEAVSFQNSAALDRAVRETTAVRPEAVARAQPLVANVQYPPAETIQAIASLLAMKLPGSPE
jgi:hypothetical protein